MKTNKKIINQSAAIVLKMAALKKLFKMRTIYDRAIQNGCTFEDTCVGITQSQWDKYMKGSTRADRKKVVKIALLAGVIDEEHAREEIKRPHFNPYNHYKTKTHIIYVHSGIEHFISVN